MQPRQETSLKAIYDTCSAFIARGWTINRPPRDWQAARAS
jgi:hypothetical protein